MPVYMLHGFRWPRAGFTGIRVYIVLHNLEEAAAEYIQQPLTTSLIMDSFNKTNPDLLPRLPELQFIEQYDPADETSGTVSQDYAYVGARVLTIPDGGDGATAQGGQNIEDVVEQGSGLTEDQTAALETLRDRLAPGEKIGWYLVYNGDPERWFPESESESEDEDYEEDGDGKGSVDGRGESSTEPPSPQSVTVCSLDFGYCLCCLCLDLRVGRVLTLSIGSVDEVLQSDELGVMDALQELGGRLQQHNLIIHHHVYLPRLCLGIGALTKSTLYV
jgi:hypothetical protein